MDITRRQFLNRTAAVAAGVPAAITLLGSRWAWAEDASTKIRVGACDWSLGAVGPNGMEVAKGIGLDGLEISAGAVGDKLPISDPAIRQQYKDAMQKLGIAIPSVAMTLTNSYPLASDPRAVAWIEQCIEGAKDLGAKCILMAFFGKGDLRGKGDKLKKDEVDALVERLKAVAPKAEEAGVALGLENTLSARDNLSIIGRVGSSAVQVYYDVRNSTDGGFDVPAELRMLDKRICQIHFKDGINYLGEGDVKMPPIAEALKEIKYDRWIVLETSIPSKNRDADFKRNAEFVRKLMA
jgi:sugar phosphate isomerase/epimerase